MITHRPMKGRELKGLRQSTTANRRHTSTATGAATVPDHLTQEEAAAFLGVTKTTYARYERDDQPIPKTFAKLARLVLVGDIDLDSSDA